ncbi:hypothetical protein ITJ86_03205, partial [Winogradskyella sp. F6397]|nr:hypothetical protein [Winogradskyella marina]
MKKLLLLLILITSNLIYSQVGIGTDMPNPSTQLEIVSGNRGILIPQLPLTSVTDQTTISAGNIESLLVYNTNTSSTLSPGYYYWFEGRWNKLMVEDDLPDNIVFWDIQNNEFTYTDENGDDHVINMSDLENLTYLGLNTEDFTLEYTDEDGVVTSIDLEDVIKHFEVLTTIVANSDGTFTFTDEEGNLTVIDISDLETITSLALNADNTHIDYTDENGTVTQLDLTQIVQNLETLTTVVENNDGTFSFTDEAGSTTIIDIGNLETITSIQDNGDGTITYRDENGNETVISLSAGPAGQDGTSAYEEWLAAGHSGSEQDFLGSLVGADGADGIDGTSVTVTDNGNGTITVSDGTNDVIVTNGTDGEDGVDGTSVTVTDNGNGTVTVSDGTT